MKRSRLIALMQAATDRPDEVTLAEILEVVTADFKSQIDYRKDVMNPLFLEISKMMNHLSERLERIERHTQSPVYQALIEDEADDIEQEARVNAEVVEEVADGEDD